MIRIRHIQYLLLVLGCLVTYASSQQVSLSTSSLTFSARPVFGASYKNPSISAHHLSVMPQNGADGNMGSRTSLSGLLTM
jgi:hypothetical protein